MSPAYRRTGSMRVQPGWPGQPDPGPQLAPTIDGGWGSYRSVGAGRRLAVRRSGRLRSRSPACRWQRPVCNARPTRAGAATTNSPSHPCGAVWSTTQRPPSPACSTLESRVLAHRGQRPGLPDARKVRSPWLTAPKRHASTRPGPGPRRNGAAPRSGVNPPRGDPAVRSAHDGHRLAGTHGPPTRPDTAATASGGVILRHR